MFVNDNDGFYYLYFAFTLRIYERRSGRGLTVKNVRGGCRGPFPGFSATMTLRDIPQGKHLKPASENGYCLTIIEGKSLLTDVSDDALTSGPVSDVFSMRPGIIAVK